MRRSVFKHCRMREMCSALFAICAFVCVSTTATADDLIISAGFAGKASVMPNEKIELSINRALQAADGGLAVLIGDTDVTAMLVVEAGHISYVPRLPLPVGESDVTVWLILTG